MAPSNEAKYFYLAGINIIAINIVMPLRFQHAVAFTFRIRRNTSSSHCPDGEAWSFAR